MQSDYLPILLQVIIAIGFACGALLVSLLLGKATKRNATKDTAYECGMVAQGEGQPRFSVKFYLVAMLFILFDIEVIFLYPWAGALLPLRDGYGIWLALVPMGVFLFILIAGLVYEWSKGALEWE